MKKNNKILIVGSGGREHAVGWKLKESPQDLELFFAPGNAGTLEIGTNVEIGATDVEKLLEFAKRENIGLTLALPDDPLSMGIVDSFEKEGLRIFGPTQKASKLEWSKAYAKEFMEAHKLPTASFGVFNNFEKAKSYLLRQKYPIVLKASGLALGKGVLIAQNEKEALEALEDILVKKTFGNAGDEVVIEDYLEGLEISTHAFSDGKTTIMFPASKDHKRIGDGDKGENTGGMGTIAPLDFIEESLMSEIKSSIVDKTIKGMREAQAPFKGVLYPGLMLTLYGPKILEFNARFGDPETQTYMRLLDTDLYAIINAIIDENLDKIEIKWKKEYACTIMLASSGYPKEYKKGFEISGIKDAEMMPGIVVFHSGTKSASNKTLTNGGRVLGISATGKTLNEALERAYEAIKKVSFEGMQYRKDIGKKLL